MPRQYYHYQPLPIKPFRLLSAVISVTMRKPSLKVWIWTISADNSLFSIIRMKTRRRSILTMLA